MLSNVRGSVPIIFLVTDGSVEDERHICDTMKNSLRDGRPICPRIYTFGIGNGFGYFVLVSCLKTALELCHNISDDFLIDLKNIYLLVSDFLLIN
jgi:hypothetical protein